MTDTRGIPPFCCIINRQEHRIMNHLKNASKHGDLITRQGLAYCEDDNTFQPYNFQVRAWACLLSDAPKVEPVTTYETWEELWAAMFECD